MVPIVQDQEVMCFPDDGKTPEAGFVQVLLAAVGEGSQPAAFVVKHSSENPPTENKKTWLREQVLPMSLLPKGLLILLEEKKKLDGTRGASPWRTDARDASHFPPEDRLPGDFSSPSERPTAPPSGKPLYLAFDATGVDPALLEKAVGRPFTGPSGQKIGDIFKVQDNKLIVEVDASLADAMREDIAAGNLPPRAEVFEFPKVDKG